VQSRIDPLQKMLPMKSFIVEVQRRMETPA
jgi:hypothetical protein